MKPFDDSSVASDRLLFQGQPAIALRLPDTSQAVVMLHGAQLVSWRTADGVEQLFLSPNAVFDGRSAIRGGVPVCFPQFNQRVIADRELPKHGFARAVSWRVGNVSAQPDLASVRLELSQADLPANLSERWPMSFAATLEVTLASNHIRIGFEVHNTGRNAWPFALALHSYLRLGDIRLTRLAGLQGVRYWDAVTHLHDTDKLQTESEAAIMFHSQTDRVYQQVPRSLTLDCADRLLRIEQSPGFSETVVWNPGADLCATLADMPTDGYRRMLCVEAAKIDQPIVLEPGQRWLGWQQFSREAVVRSP